MMLLIRKYYNSMNFIYQYRKTLEKSAVPRRIRRRPRAVRAQFAQSPKERHFKPSKSTKIQQS